MDSRCCVVLVTVSGPEEGKRIGEALVADKLAACVNQAGGIASLFWWEGKIQREAEELLIIKTRPELLEELSRRVKELHSYTVPEILALPIVGGNPEYLAWVEEATRR